jgi:hypothetical protein
MLKIRLSNKNKEVEMDAMRNETLEGVKATPKTMPIKLLLSTIAGGFAMWVVGGFWHNLILPIFDSNAQAHHDGLVIVLISYFILAFLMAYLFLLSYQEHKSVISEGTKIGVLVGILWVFPHSLAMAGTHDTSIVYEIKNTLYHMIEKGIGGVIIAFIMVKRNK